MLVRDPSAPCLRSLCSKKLFLSSRTAPVVQLTSSSLLGYFRIVISSGARKEELEEFLRRFSRTARRIKQSNQHGDYVATKPSSSSSSSDSGGSGQE